MAGQRSCVFCKNNKSLNREHVFPDWLKRFFPEDYIIHNQFVSETLSFDWKSKIFEHKSKSVCESCNSGWMSTLESKTIPILTPLLTMQDITLSKEEQHILSFWVQKTILMLNQAIPNGLKITQDLFQDIYASKTCSKKVLVNIGRRTKYKGTIDEPIASYYIIQIPNVTVHSPLLKEVTTQKNAGGFIWKATLALGPVVFETIGHNMKITLEVSSNTRVFKTINPYKEPLKWLDCIPTETEATLDMIKNRY